MVPIQVLCRDISKDSQLLHLLTPRLLASGSTPNSKGSILPFQADNTFFHLSNSDLLSARSNVSNNLCPLRLQPCAVVATC